MKNKINKSTEQCVVSSLQNLSKSMKINHFVYEATELGELCRNKKGCISFHRVWVRVPWASVSQRFISNPLVTTFTGKIFISFPGTYLISERRLYTPLARTQQLLYLTQHLVALNRINSFQITCGLLFRVPHNKFSPLKSYNHRVMRILIRIFSFL